MQPPDGEFLRLGHTAIPLPGMFEDDTRALFGTSTPFSPDPLPVPLNDMEPSSHKPFQQRRETTRAPKHADFAGR